MNKMRMKKYIFFLVFAVFTSATDAQVFAPSYTPLYELGTRSGDPAYPQGVFAQGCDGNLYSTSSAGGANGFGAVFQLTPSGTMNILYNFTRVNGSPLGGLTLGADCDFYGTTYSGGTNTLNFGSVFKITTGGTFTLLHAFNNTTEGCCPLIAPIQGTDGNFYGTASNGGTYYGTIYMMTPTGAMTPLFEFTGAYASPDLRYPTVLLQAKDGNFYGITPGAQNAGGLVYQMTPQGNLTPLHPFPHGGSLTDGAGPTDLVQGSDGNFYGTTRYGGPSGHGTIFKMSPTGTPYTILQYSQQANFAGLYPQSMTQATDGKFYGEALSDDNFLDGCSGTHGLLFQSTASGANTNLFCNFKGPNGVDPADPLLQHTNGKFYSATYEGGGGTCLSCFGVLYSFDMGFSPFITFVPSQSEGKAGDTIGILGQGFNGTSNVSFNGVAATFNIVSDTYLTATVPNGASTGPVTVTLGGGTLASNRDFRISGAALVSIAVTPANPSVPQGNTQPFTATGTYSDGSTQDITVNVNWASSSTAVASINASGIASALTAGTTSISATQSGVSNSTTMTVVGRQLVSIAVTPTNPSVQQGASQPFTATGTYSDGSMQNITGNVNWASSNTAVASINVSGVASALTTGTTSISAMQGSISNSTMMTVVGLQSITISPINPSTFVGSTIQFTATGHYSDGSTRDLTSTVVWTSSNNSVATITSAGGFPGGSATGIAKGSATITAAAGALSASTTLTVNAVALQSITVTPATATISVGGTQQFTATGTYNNGRTQDITGTVTWSSSPDHMVAVSSTGLATGLKAGIATISGKSKGIKGSATLTVQ